MSEAGDVLGESLGGGCASISSIGPSMSVSGVRNSWLTLEKKVVLARSISASASARLRSASKGTRIRNARGDMACDEIEEAAVVGIEDAARAHAGDQEASGSRLGLCGQRQHKGSLDRVRPWTGGEDADSAGKIGYLARPAGLRDSAQRPGPAHLPSMTGWLSGKPVEPLSNRVPATRRALVPSSSSR